MKVVYRIIAILLTLISAGITAILISVATDETREIRVVNFTLFAIGAAAGLIIAIWLWRRSNTLTTASPTPPPPPPPGDSTAT